MEKHHKNERIKNITRKVREDGSINIYREEMIKNFDLWLDFDYKDWLIVLGGIKNEPLKLYAFFPFICRILGIEILHEFRALKDVKRSVLNYVNEGKGLHMYSLHAHDIEFYKKHGKTIEKAYELIDKLNKQGATPIKSYTLYVRKRTDKSISRYKTTITREHFTTIKIEDICQDEYLYDQRTLDHMG